MSWGDEDSGGDHTEVAEFLEDPRGRVVSRLGRRHFCTIPFASHSPRFRWAHHACTTYRGPHLQCGAVSHCGVGSMLAPTRNHVGQSHSLRHHFRSMGSRPAEAVVA